MKRILTAVILSSTMPTHSVIAEQAKPAVKEDYCSSFADEAAETRNQLQTKKIQDLKDEIKKLLAEVQLKSSELESRMKDRQKLRQQATDSLLKIYSNMEPDAAVKILQKLQPETSAQVLLNLSPKLASEILALMPPRESARVSAHIAALSRL
jgi:flagellar motility protein MotE (MotC chaperone)